MRYFSPLLWHDPGESKGVAPTHFIILNRTQIYADEHRYFLLNSGFRN